MPPKADDVYLKVLSDREMDQAIVLMKRGTRVLACRRLGRPKSCSIRLSSDESELVYQVAGKQEKALKLNSVTQIKFGTATGTFQRTVRSDKDGQSFSILYNNGEGSLDLILKDAEEAETWFLALRSIMQRQGQGSARARASKTETGASLDLGPSRPAADWSPEGSPFSERMGQGHGASNLTPDNSDHGAAVASSIPLSKSTPELRKHILGVHEGGASPLLPEDDASDDVDILEDSTGGSLHSDVGPLTGQAAAPGSGPLSQSGSSEAGSTAGASLLGVGGGQTSGSQSNIFRTVSMTRQGILPSPSEGAGSGGYAGSNLSGLSSNGDDAVPEGLGDLYVWGKGLQGGQFNATSLGAQGYAPGTVDSHDAYLPQALEAGVVLDVTDVSCGEGHAMLLTRSGEVFSWGVEDGGRLGLGVVMDAQAPVLVDSLSNTPVQDVACSSHVSSAVTRQGELLVWGDGTRCPGVQDVGVATGGVPDVHQWQPRRVGSGLLSLRVVHVSCGPYHVAAVTRTGQLFTFGQGTFGALGHGNLEDVTEPKEVVHLKGMRTIRVACGVWHTAAVVDVVIGDVFARGGGGSCRLFTWGDADKGKLGLNAQEAPTDIVSVPTVVNALGEESICQVACGETLTVALAASGQVYSMGSSKNGQLGVPGFEGKVPVRVQGALHRKRVQEIACGASHVVALTSASEVYSWGCGANGRLGLGDASDRNTPTLVEALKDFRTLKIACGAAMTAAICLNKPRSDGDQSLCSNCKQPFSYTRLRHNCYNCAQSFCHSCSSRKTMGAAMAPSSSKPYRVCDACYVKVTKTSAAAPSLASLSMSSTSSAGSSAAAALVGAASRSSLVRRMASGQRRNKRATSTVPELAADDKSLTSSLEISASMRKSQSDNQWQSSFVAAPVSAPHAPGSASLRSSINFPSGAFFKGASFSVAGSGLGSTFGIPEHHSLPRSDAAALTGPISPRPGSIVEGSSSRPYSSRTEGSLGGVSMGGPSLARKSSADSLSLAAAPGPPFLPTHSFTLDAAQGQGFLAKALSLRSGSAGALSALPSKRATDSRARHAESPLRRIMAPVHPPLSHGDADDGLGDSSKRAKVEAELRRLAREVVELRSQCEALKREKDQANELAQRDVSAALKMANEESLKASAGRDVAQLLAAQIAELAKVSQAKPVRYASLAPKLMESYTAYVGPILDGATLPPSLIEVPSQSTEFNDARSGDSLGHGISPRGGGSRVHAAPGEDLLAAKGALGDCKDPKFSAARGASGDPKDPKLAAPTKLPDPARRDKAPQFGRGSSNAVSGPILGTRAKATLQPGRLTEGSNLSRFQDAAHASDIRIVQRQGSAGQLDASTRHTAGAPGAAGARTLDENDRSSQGMLEMRRADSVPVSTRVGSLKDMAADGASAGEAEAENVEIKTGVPAADSFGGFNGDRPVLESPQAMGASVVGFPRSGQSSGSQKVHGPLVERDGVNSHGPKVPDLPQLGSVRKSPEKDILDENPAPSIGPGKLPHPAVKPRPPALAMGAGESEPAGWGLGLLSPKPKELPGNLASPTSGLPMAGLAGGAPGPAPGAPTAPEYGAEGSSAGMVQGANWVGTVNASGKEARLSRRPLVLSDGGEIGRAGDGKVGSAMSAEGSGPDAQAKQKRPSLGDLQVAGLDTSRPDSLAARSDSLASSPLSMIVGDSPELASPPPPALKAEDSETILWLPITPSGTTADRASAVDSHGKKKSPSVQDGTAAYRHAAPESESKRRGSSAPDGAGDARGKARALFEGLGPGEAAQGAKPERSSETGGAGVGARGPRAVNVDGVAKPGGVQPEVLAAALEKCISGRTSSKAEGASLKREEFLTPSQSFSSPDRDGPSAAQGSRPQGSRPQGGGPGAREVMVATEQGEEEGAPGGAPIGLLEQQSTSSVARQAGLQSDGEGGGSRPKDGAGSKAREGEWVESPEPGVFVTLGALPGGGNELRRVRFSRKAFAEKDAEVWWSENKARVAAMFNVKSTARKPKSSAS